MKLAKVDDKHRILIPELEPGKAFTWENNGQGQIILLEVKPGTKVDAEPFPPGSLVDCAEEWNAEFADLAKGMKVPAPPKDWE